MTGQDIFSRVARHLVRQNRRAERNGEYALRGDDGTKCAVGALIPDDVYRPDMEGLLVPKLLASGLLVPPVQAALEPHKQLLIRLQMIHDCLDPSSWPRALERIALLEGYRMPEELFIALLPERP